MAAAREAAPKLVELSKKHEVILVHGNGPQVGILAVMEQSYSAQTGTTPYTFDCLGYVTHRCRSAHHFPQSRWF
jgi:carbamate kinase